MLSQYDDPRHQVQRNYLKILTLPLTLLSTAVLGAGLLGNSAQTPTVLPVEKAIVVARPSHTEVALSMAPGVYLYDERTWVETVDGTRLETARPDGTPYDDPLFGLTPIHRGDILLTLSNPPERVVLHYQGCADIGFCYPPMQTELSFSR